MRIHYQEVQKGWHVRDDDNNTATVLDTHCGIVHAVQPDDENDDPKKSKLRFSFNWRLARRPNGKEWGAVIPPQFITSSESTTNK
jgi:hypothetical protein